MSASFAGNARGSGTRTEKETKRTGGREGAAKGVGVPRCLEDAARANLVVGPPHDDFEREADAVAEAAGRADAAGGREPTRAPGDRSAPRYLSVLAPGPGQPVAIQRQEESPLPEVPRFELTPPSLLRPRDPYSRYRPDFGFRLRMDPEIEAEVRARARMLLSPENVLSRVASRAPVVPVPGAGGVAGPEGAPPAGPVPAAPGAGAGPTGGGPIPAPAPPPSPAPSPEPGHAHAARERTPRPGTGGDVMKAVLALPQVGRLVEDVQSRFTTDFSRYWSSASRGEQIGFVTSSVVVGSAVLAPILGFEETRDFVLPKLGDLVIPVPGLSGYGLQFRFSERDVMIGAHLDVGALLPSIWGFGPSSFEPISGPPTPLPYPHLSRSADGSGPAPGAESIAGAEAVAAAVRSRRGRGAPLDERVREEMEPALGADLGGVRVHTDAEADALARSVRARAFASGRDLFFRSGRYDPDNPQGRELLAHELVHVTRQAHGPAPAPAAGGGLHVSEPQDAAEREADRVAARATRRATP